jgi:uncharacterized membrane protein YkgB
MRGLYAFFHRVDEPVVRWMGEYGVPILRISLGIVFLWFGALKFFPGLSPAEGLAAKTIHQMTFGALEPHLSLPILATWECLIGLGLLFRAFLRLTLFLLFLQMPGTLMPLFLYPEETFRVVPYAPNLEGQYILKNLVLISAGIVIGATVRGGRAVVKDPPEE